MIRPEQMKTARSISAVCSVFALATAPGAGTSTDGGSPDDVNFVQTKQANGPKEGP